MYAMPEMASHEFEWHCSPLLVGWLGPDSQLAWRRSSRPFASSRTVLHVFCTLFATQRLVLGGLTND